MSAGDKCDIFLHGSRWLRADFHLHTAADKEFSYSGEENSYCSDYVDALKKAEISLGIITNHNKFDAVEFKALRKSARRKNICLIPGVELSVNDGSNGIHTLIVFSGAWLAKSEDYISPFLTSMFPGESPNEYQNKSGRSDKNILQVVEELEKTGRDYFIVFAHVEQASGLWKEMSGGKLSDFKSDRYESARQRILAFQKVRTRDDRDKVKDLLGNWYPAEVEGSDCKSVDQIGRGKPCYLKIGDFSFGAVKYALLDHANRIATELKEHKHSYIIDVSFDGGVLDGETINLSPELNTLIGIRGSGKSSILETIRYALDIPFGEKARDTDYKRHLVDYVLGSDGRVTLRAVDQRGQHYEIRRINRQMPDVYVDGIRQPGISIRETVIHKPIYFGQKDLSATGEGFEKDLVEKLVGEKLASIRHEIECQRQKVTNIVTRLLSLSSMREKKQEYTEQIQDAEFRLKFYRDHGVEEKLQRQVDFDADSRKCSSVVSFVKSYLAGLEDFVNQFEDDLQNQHVYTSEQNKEYFESYFAILSKLISSFERIKKELDGGNLLLTELVEKTEEFDKLKDSFKEEFAEIGRRLSEQLRQSGAQSIRPDEFRQLRRTVDHASQMLSSLDKQETVKQNLKQELITEIGELNELWRSEYRAIHTELEKVNGSHSSLEIKSEFRGDKDSFVAFMKDMFRGSRIRESKFVSLAEMFPDFGAIYRDSKKVVEEVGTSAPVFKEYFENNLAALLTWQVPNKFIIEYRGKELKHHSLGQRASALILFVLSQQENDLFIIDQPEDDLDNQTIYEDVIKLIRQLKPKTQFIFATHNANFPVLGDAEQVISCAFSDDTVHVTVGSIDCSALQKEIVDIMEGGEEAFRQRRRRYEIWKP